MTRIEDAAAPLAAAPPRRGPAPLLERIERRIAQFPADKLLEIESVLRRLLGL